MLRGLLAELGIDTSEFTNEHRLRSDLALESTETVELEVQLRRRYGVVVDLWDIHDYTLGELDALIVGVG